MYNLEFNKKVRKCDECKKNYIPTSASQKYCKKCSPIVRARNAEKLKEKYRKLGIHGYKKAGGKK